MSGFDPLKGRLPWDERDPFDRSQWTIQEQDTFPDGWSIVVKQRKGGSGIFKTFVSPKPSSKTFMSFVTAANSVDLGEMTYYSAPSKGDSRKGASRKGDSRSSKSKDQANVKNGDKVGSKKRQTSRKDVEPPQQHKYVGIAKDPSLYAPKNLGPKKRFPITFVKTIVPLKKITYPPSSSSSSPTFDYAFDRKSAIGKAAIARKKNSKLSTDDDPPPIDSLQNGIDSPPSADITASGPPPPFAPTLAWDPNSGPGMHVGSRIWAIDEQGTKDNLKHGRGFGRKEDKKKPFNCVKWDTGRIVDYDKTTSEYTVHFDEPNEDGTIAIDKINCNTDAAMIANNVVWSRFSKQPWWPALTLIPNKAAKDKGYVPPNQVTGSRMRLFYFLTNERGEVNSNNDDVVTQFEATVWPKREDYHGDGSRLSSEHTPVANPINPSHILAPDPNKIEKAKKGSNKYLSAISVACEEIEERKKAREKAISTMSDGGRKRLKFASNGWLNCQIEFRQKNNKMIKAFVHRYSIKRKKWLLTIEGGPKGGSKDKGGKGNATQRSNTQGQWMDLRNIAKVTKLKDYDDDDENDSPMDEDVVVPAGYIDYSCKYCKLSVLDENDNFLPSCMLQCAGCEKFVHGDTCLDPPLPRKVMNKYYAPPETIEEQFKTFYCDECKQCESCGKSEPGFGVKAVAIRPAQTTSAPSSLDSSEVRTKNLCTPCEKLIKKNHFCKVCLKTFDEDNFLAQQSRLNDADGPDAGGAEGELTTKSKSSKQANDNNALPSPLSSWGLDTLSLLQCSSCKSHVHASCCDVTLSDFDLMKQGKHPFLNISFLCLSCHQEKALAIIQRLRKIDTLFIFHLPVTDAVAPNYRDVVKEPMDLQTMEKRAKEGKDKNCLWVRECFEQIVYNALTFNADLGKIWLEAKRFNERGLKTIFEGQALQAKQLPIGGICPPSKYHDKIIANYTRARDKALKERERVVVDNETEKKDLLAGHVDVIEILPLVPPANVETCIPRAMIGMTADQALPSSWLDCCFVCGSSGANDVMMFCVDCGEAFHSFCSGAPIECMDPVAIASWRCSNCKVCELTGVATKNEQALLYCECCDRAVSMELLQPPLDKAPEGSWVCGLCVYCDECGESGLPISQWSCDARLCFRCGGAKEMADTVGNIRNSCSVCKQYTIEGLDKLSSFYFCVKCDRVCHKTCVASVESSYAALGPPHSTRKITPGTYECLDCAMDAKKASGEKLRAIVVKKGGLVESQAKSAKELSEIRAQKKQWETMEIKREQYLRLIEDASELLYLIDKDVMEVKDDARRNYVEVRKKVLTEEADAARRRRERGERGGQSIPSTSHMKRLEEIRVALVKSNDSYLFRRAVDKKTYPKYYEMIERPIDLNSIGKIIQKRTYNTTKSFLEDIQLLYQNSCKFNTPESPISKCALNLVALAKAKIEESADDFAAWESQMVTISSPLKRTNPPKSTSVASTNGVQQMELSQETKAKIKNPDFPIPPSKLLVEQCMYPSVFKKLGFRRSVGFEVTETQEQRAARFARMKKRKRSVTDVDELHQVEGKSSFHISSIANEAKLAASFINVNMTNSVIKDTTRQEMFTNLSDMKGLLAPTDADTGLNSVLWSGKFVKKPKEGNTKKQVTTKGGRDVFGLTFALRGEEDQLGLSFQDGMFRSSSGKEHQAIFVSDVRPNGQAKELAGKNGKDIVAQRTRVTNYPHMGALKNAQKTLKTDGGGLLSLNFVTMELMVARVFGDGSIGGAGSPSSVPLKKRKPEQHAALQELKLAASHSGPLKKRKLVSTGDGGDFERGASSLKQETDSSNTEFFSQSPSKKRRTGNGSNGTENVGGGGADDMLVDGGVTLAMDVSQQEDEKPPLIPLSVPLTGWRGEIKGLGRWSDKRMCCFCDNLGDDDGGTVLCKKAVPSGDRMLGFGSALGMNKDAGGVLGGHVIPRPSEEVSASTKNLPESGRLVPVDFTMPGSWAHTACALWSSEVYEDEFGKLYSVQKSKVRTRQIRCTFCNLLGAGLGCCSKDCKDAFHFKCAQAVHGVFCANKTFYCPKHKNEAANLEKLDPHSVVEIMRCITVTSAADAKHKGANPFKVVPPDHLINLDGSITRIGALVLHDLGEIVTDSDNFHDSMYIYPRGFTSTRIFWSASTPRLRTVYNLRIVESQGRALFVIRAADDRSVVITSHSADDAYEQLLQKVKRTNGDYFSRPYDKHSSLPVWRNGAVLEGIDVDSDTQTAIKREERRVKRTRAEVGINNDGGLVVAYGLNASHFFGFGLNVVRKNLELMDEAKFLAVPLTTESRRYGFVYVLPTQGGITAVQRIRALAKAENELHNVTGCARSEGMAAFDKSSGAGRITRALLENEQSSSAKDGLGADGGAEEGGGGGGRRGGRDRGARRAIQDMGESVDYSQQYFELKSGVLEDRLCPLRSHIHGWGLFTKVDFSQNDMIIEYCGELIRNCVTDRREADYENRGIGSCYMFRLDRQHVIDATLNGSMARFMNHCCVPNAYAKTIEVPSGIGDGKKVNKIIIFAKTDIKAGEEVVYDYQFAVEDGSLKCTCGHPQCIGAMN